MPHGIGNDDPSITPSREFMRHKSLCGFRLPKFTPVVSKHNSG